MNYTSVGSIFVGNCASYTYTINLTHLYDVGDIVYSRPKALRGFLRKFCIKELRYDAEYIPRSTLCRYCDYPPLYIDTFNAYHNEEDLVTLSDAQELITAYLILEAANIELHVINCS